MPDWSTLGVMFISPAGGEATQPGLWPDNQLPPRARGLFYLLALNSTPREASPSIKTDLQSGD